MACPLLSLTGLALPGCRCLREISAVSALPAHPNIVGQYRAWQEGGHFYIQMDLCDGGSLHQLIAAVSVRNFGWDLGSV